MPAAKLSRTSAGDKVKRKEDEGTKDRTRDRGHHSEISQVAQDGILFTQESLTPNR